MAKRMTKSESTAIATLLVIGIPIFLIYKLGESVGWLLLAAIVVGVIVLSVAISISNKKKRRAYLLDKYQDEEIVDSIMNRSFWQGQTGEQLIDSLGKPHDIDQKILKSKKKEVWKYNHQGGKRYGLRITLDDDIVVGWDQKNITRAWTLPEKRRQIRSKFISPEGHTKRWIDLNRIGKKQNRVLVFLGFVCVRFSEVL